MAETLAWIWGFGAGCFVGLLTGLLVRWLDRPDGVADPRHQVKE